MNYEEALTYIHSLERFGSKPGLERIAALCRALGDPQDELEFIHVAGTNGKGSVSAMIAEMLRAKGLNVGLYTSPYVLRFNERITVDGTPVGDDDLADTVAYVKRFADGLTEQITEFEFITAAAFTYFYNRKCDVVVLETGLGGRFDATNIIKKPRLSVITGIALDHTAVLGDTVEKIAFEKAGIVKPGAPVLYGEAGDGAAAVIAEAARAHGSKLYRTEFDRISDVKYYADGTEFSVRGYYFPFRCGLAGEYQPRNAMTAITAAEILGLGDGEIRAGLERVKWKARFEKLRDDPTVIYDGAHNPQGADAAVRSLRAVFGDKKPVLFTGMMRDKDCGRVARAFSDAVCLAVCVRPGNPRSIDPRELADLYRGNGIEARAFDGFSEAMSFAVGEAKKRGTFIFAAGSLYMYADFVHALDNELPPS